MSTDKKRKRTTGRVRHCLRSWLVRDEHKGKLAVQVQCERCGATAREPLPVPLALNEMHKYALAAKDQINGRCV